MQVTIIPSDRIVAIDGVAQQVEMDGIDPNIHAVQWYGSYGHIEFVDGSCNEEIQSIDNFSFLLERHAAATQSVANPYAGMTAQQMIEIKVAQISNACDEADQQPILFNGEVFKASSAISETVNKINMLGLSDTDSIPCNNGCWDNLDMSVEVPFTCGEFKVLAAAYYDRADRNYQNLKALIKAAYELVETPGITAAEVAAFDHTTGWNSED